MKVGAGTFQNMSTANETVDFNNIKKAFAKQWRQIDRVARDVERAVDQLGTLNAITQPYTSGEKASKSKT